jgi:hypothetical protein
MKASPYLVLALVLTVCFTLATGIEPRAATWSNRSKSDNVFSMLFGDGRRLFANQFFTMADVYFHSGYYPSIFDLREEGPKEIVAESHGHTDSPEDEIKEDFLGKPKDWIDRFGRHFRITEHTHLEHGNEREILPWLRLAADMDPQKIETYTVGSFFMRLHLNQPREAEAFLREGLRNNPDSYEILFELGRLYNENYHDAGRARTSGNSLRRWLQLDPQAQKENKLGFEEITVHLAQLERTPATGAGHPLVSSRPKVSPDPNALQQQIDEIKKTMAAQPMPRRPPRTNREIALCFSPRRSGLIAAMKARQAKISRNTKETRIAVRLNLDGRGKSSIKTGIPFFDHMLTLFAKHATVDLQLRCAATWKWTRITRSRIAASRSARLCAALGDKRGIRRYGTAFIRKIRSPAKPMCASSSLFSTFTILNCSACMPVSARKDSLPK